MATFPMLVSHVVPSSKAIRVSSFSRRVTVLMSRLRNANIRNRSERDPFLSSNVPRKPQRDEIPAAVKHRPRAGFLPGRHAGFVRERGGANNYQEHQKCCTHKTHLHSGTSLCATAGARWRRAVRQPRRGCGEALPVRPWPGSYSPPSNGLFYSAGDPTRASAWLSQHRVSGDGAFLSSQVIQSPLFDKRLV